MRPIDVIEGKVSVLDRNDVDTDQIIPKQFLKRVERTGFGEFLFYDWIRDGEIELEPNPILVAGRNFGCGSSREHAPWALEDFGFEAIIAPSFADIFYSNCTKIGLLPAIVDEAHCKLIAAGRRGADRRRRRDDRLRHHRRLPVRGPAGRQAPAAERARRHRDHPAERRRDRHLRELGPAPSGRSRPASRRGPERRTRWPSRAPATGTRRTYQRVALPHEDWARARARPARAERRRDRPRRGLRLRPHHRDRDLAAPRGPRDRGRRLALDGRGGEGGAAAGGRRRSSPTSPSWSWTSTVDAIFSTAVFHWIPDHDALFAADAGGAPRGRPLRRPVRRRGQHRRLPRSPAEVAAPRALRRVPRPTPTSLWNYAGPEETEERLRAAGFDRGPLLAEPWPVDPSDPRSSPRPSASEPTSSSCPDDLRDRFVADVLATQPEPLRLDYVRLNIAAVQRPE